MGIIGTSLTVSLDGFIAGPNDGMERPLGEGGDRLFAWMSAGPPVERGEAWLEKHVGPGTPPEASRPVIDSWVNEYGALISGRRTFDIAGGWKEGHPVEAPIFVVTHEAPTEGEWSPRVQFVTEGLDRAVELAQEAAGDLKVSAGAASVVQQLLRAGKLDEIEVNIVPYLLGGGVRLLDHIGSHPVELEQDRVIESDGVTHLRYRVLHS